MSLERDNDGERRERLEELLQDAENLRGRALRATQRAQELMREQNRRLEDGQQKLNRLVDDLRGLQRRLAEFLDEHRDRGASVVPFAHRCPRWDHKKGAA
jgi:hypothetical protein